jgi:ankyrin repeat protein
MAPSSLFRFVLTLAIAFVTSIASAVEGSFADVDASLVQGNYAKARRLLDEMAQRGDMDAQYRLANLYRAGIGIPQDLKESARLYQEAATAGHIPSQYMVGQCYERGIGFPTDIVKAGEWYTRAARSGDTRALERLHSLSQKPGDLLTLIAMPDEDAVIGRLGGHDLTIADDQGQTLLMAAAAAGHARVVTFLLDAHLDTNQRDRAERTALFYAAEQGHDNVVEALLDAGANPNLADRNGDTPLHVAIAHRQQRVVTLLTRHGANLAARNAAGWTAAQLAQAKGVAADPSKATSTEQLDPTARLAGLRKDKRFEGWPDLSVAAWSGDVKLVELLTANADTNARDGIGQTALSRAVDQGHAEVVAVLLAHGARDDSMLPGGQTSLQVAIEKNYDTIAIALLAAGAPTDAVDAQGRFALGLAASRTSAEMTSRLLDHHADPNVRGAGGRTALMIAAESGVAESVRSLLEHGAYATLADERGRTALWYASGSSDSHDVKLLLTALKPIPTTEKFPADSSGVTPLHRAVSAHSAESVDALLKSGHNPNVASSSGSTPLHLAAIDGDIASATLLVAAGAHLDSRDTQGNTPLFRAANADHFEMAKYLLQQGADARIRNSNSASAYDLAHANPESRWLAMFDEHSRSVLSLLTQ